MFKNFSNFIYKFYYLTKYFLVTYSSSLLKLETFDLSNNIHESIVYFYNIKTGQSLSKNLKELFENKNILKNFSSQEAAEIGFCYGKLLNNNEK